MSDSDNTKLSKNSNNAVIVESHTEVTKENLWKNDCTKRKPFAEMFTKIIGKIGVEKPAVILLDGEWGSGKTFFLQSLRHELVDNKYKAIYFDAFAEDFSTDPLLAICGQLWKELSVGESVSVKEKSNEELGNVLKDIVGIVMKKEKLQNINTLDLGLLTQYADSRKMLATLKKRLSTVVTKSDKPLVFIIDELDRCRPTFALELLERVKHLFQVPGIIFVFGANKKSLMASVRSEYGEQEDEYLQKFFDIDLKLPNASPSVLAKQYIDKFKYEILDDNRRKISAKDKEIITHELYYPLMDIMDVTLRQMQRSVQMFSMFLLISAENDKIQRWDKVGTAACLTLLKVSHPKLYADIAYQKGEKRECRNVIAKISPMFDKWDNFNATAGFVYSGHSHYSDPVIVSKRCRFFFNRTISILAEGEEKQIINGVYHQNNEFGVSNGEQWSWVQSNMLDRFEIVRMLENLDCRS